MPTIRSVSQNQSYITPRHVLTPPLFIEILKNAFIEIRAVLHRIHTGAKEAAHKHYGIYPNHGFAAFC